MELITDPAILEGYLTDASNLRGQADALLRPTTAEEVAEIVGHCQRTQTPLTITAARTSTTGAPVPFGGWVMSLERLRTIRHIGTDTATAEAGILLGAFQEEIEAKGRFFPPDPTSRHDCTLGGAIACNASGARSFRYGPTRPWVESIRVVLPDGTLRDVSSTDPVPEDWPPITWQEPQVKTAAGYAPPTSLLDLFIGQEGTLGVIVEATVRLTELRETFGLLAFFPDRKTAVNAARQLRKAARHDPSGALAPRCIEYLDAHCLRLARERVDDVPSGAGAALFCEQEITQDPDEHLGAWWEALESSDALIDDTIFADDPPGQARLHALRHAVPAGINEQVVRNRMPKVGTDLAVPDDALDALMDAYEAAPLPHALFGHLGDNHLHLNLLPRTADELEQSRHFYTQLARQAIAAGGTVSAEHGIGKIKRDYLEMMVGADTLTSFRALKQHLDPAWVLGRGTLMTRDGS